MTSETADKKLRTTIRNFFLNNPLSESRRIMWELYTGWVYQDETGDPKEHYDLLFFYERLLEFMDELYEMTKTDDKN